MTIEPLDLSEAKAYLDGQKKALEMIRPKASALSAARMTRQTLDWVFRILSSNQVVGLDQERVVSRSRELAASDTTMAKFLAEVVKNVFGPDGIRLQSKIPMLRGGRQNGAANEIIQGAWREWGKKENCTLDRRLSWKQFQRMVGRTVVTDGEVFIRKHVGAPNPFRFALEIINSDRIDRSYGVSTPVILDNGNIIFMGIESNGQTGAVEAYHVFNFHPAEHGAGPRQRQRIPASEILHLFVPVFDNQYRGIPWAAPAMFRMNMLRGFQEAELVAARAAACTFAAITKAEDPSQPTDPNAVPDSSGGLNAPIEPASLVSLAPGESLTPYAPQHPTGVYGPFVQTAMLDIAAGLDVAYMTLSGDVGSANYSSARVGLLDERSTWESLQWWFAEDLCDPIFEAWLQPAFLTFLRSALPGGDWRAYSKAEWHPQKFAWIDPEKDTNALILQLQHGMTTLSRICESMGYSLDETVAELADDMDKLRAAGLEWMIPLIFAPKTATSANGPQLDIPGMTPAQPAESQQGASRMVNYLMSLSPKKE